MEEVIQRVESTILELEAQYGHIRCCADLQPQSLFKDEVYDDNKWYRHKSWRRHFPEPIRCLQVLAWYWPPIFAVTVISVLVGLYHTYLQPLGAPDVTNRDYTTPFTLTSFALSLLLVFRTNSSYDRWWEARKLWGGLLSICRSLVRLTLAWAGKEDEALKQAVARWTIALPYALRTHINKLKTLHPALKEVLLPREVIWLERSAHRPAAVSQVLTNLIERLTLPEYKRVALNNLINNYNDTVAACERLYGQPIPVAYTRHTSRFMITWLAFLPFAIYKNCQWLTVGVVPLMAFLLMGVENIGVQIEQPFAVLPLDPINDTIRRNIEHYLKTQSSVGGSHQGLQLVRESDEWPCTDRAEHAAGCSKSVRCSERSGYRRDDEVADFTATLMPI